MNEREALAGAFPRGVMDPFCPDEHVITESTDRRILWHLESTLAILGTSDALRDEGRNLRRYLAATCAHHWHVGVGYDDEPLRQCLWCSDVEFLNVDGGSDSDAGEVTR